MMPLVKAASTRRSELGVDLRTGLMGKKLTLLNTIFCAVPDDVQLRFLPPDDGPGGHVPDQPTHQMVPAERFQESGSGQELVTFMQCTMHMHTLTISAFAKQFQLWLNDYSCGLHNDFCCG
jgi:hypothetical protein